MGLVDLTKLFLRSRLIVQIMFMLEDLLIRLEDFFLIIQLNGIQEPIHGLFQLVVVLMELIILFIQLPQIVQIMFILEDLLLQLEAFLLIIQLNGMEQVGHHQELVVLMELIILFIQLPQMVQIIFILEVILLQLEAFLLIIQLNGLQEVIYGRRQESVLLMEPIILLKELL